MSKTTFQPTKKPCAICGKTKPLTEYGPQDGTDDGLRRECLQCRAKYQRERYRSRGISRAKTSKVCAVCEDEKPLSAFRVASGSLGRADVCKKCAKLKTYTPPPVAYPTDQFGRVKLIKHWTRAEFADVMRQLDD